MSLHLKERAEISGLLSIGYRRLDLAKISTPGREADLVEILEHLDGHVAANAAGVAECADIEVAITGERRLLRNFAQSIELAFGEIPRIGNAMCKAMPANAGQERLQPPLRYVEFGRDVGKTARS